jgi:hypothetical protein
MTGQASLEDILSSDLELFLRACPSDEVTALAVLMAGTYRKWGLLGGEDHVRMSLEKLNLRGHDLIPDMVEDIAYRSSHGLGKRVDYAQAVRIIAERHNIPVEGNVGLYELERFILKKYEISDLKERNYSKFRDKGTTSTSRKLLWAVLAVKLVDEAFHANWRMVTFFVLQLSRMRIESRARQLASVLEV